MLGSRYRNDGKSLLILNDLQKKLKNQILTKITIGRYRFEKVKCIVDGSKKFTLLSEKDRHGLYMPVVICQKCGLVQTNPRMNRKSYKEFYEKEYRQFYSGYKGVSKAFFKQQYSHGRKIFKLIGRTTGETIKNMFVVEIGTGAGGILQYFKEKRNRVFGVDMDSEYLAFGRKKGLNIIRGDVRKLKKFKMKPDLVIHSHVLEHLTDPIKELNYLRKIIKANTLLYIEVPGIKNLYHDYQLDFLRYLQNAHVYHFTLTTLINVLHKSGFEIIGETEEISSLFKKSNKKYDYYENDYEECLNFLKKLEKERNKHINSYVIKIKIKRFLVKILKKISLLDIAKQHFYISTSLSS
jgi:2-polyprenyl-3-methyl-5-hydroxy-6-metoxy-1,4-benzoquinol methylase